MALRRTSESPPAGVVVLNEQEALARQWRLVMNWSPKSDVWPFRYGMGCLAAASALSGIYINAYYRNKLHLQNFGRVSTYLPIVALPTIVSLFFHQQFITNDILLEKTLCPVCVQVRSGALQVFFGTLYPTLLAPLSSFMYATRHYTYHMPPMNAPTEHIKLWLKLTRPVGYTLLLTGFAQIVVAMGITHFEANSYFRIQAKLLEMEEKCSA